MDALTVAPALALPDGPAAVPVPPTWLREETSVLETAQRAARLARELRARPVLCDAVLRGEVSTRKARIVLPLAIGCAERGWVARAQTETVRALEKAARERAPPCDGDDETWERLELTPARDGAPLEVFGETG